ncbi:MAG: hypothetical protein IT521_16155 [Burkholderiales bacterium]|nr:hypothetical protein [Burkholderiales bacterium]
MSGPITAGYVIVHGVLVLSARALAEARAMRCEYGQVLAQLRERERMLGEARSGQRNARLERIAAVRGEAARQAARLSHLRSLGDSLAAKEPGLAQRMPAEVPAAPAGDDDAAWSEHLRLLEAAVREMETLLAGIGGAASDHVRAVLGAVSATPGIDDVLSAYVLQRQMQSGLAAAEAERFRQTAARVLSRLERVDGATLPPELEALARAIVMAPTIERAEALASELRLAVQRQREAQAAQVEESAQAKRLLDELPENAPAPLLRALEHVAAGVQRLDTALLDAAQTALDIAAADREQETQAAAALVLQESLRDLGYEVDDIEATLFAEGGTVHFRREGWDSYYVRLRVDPREHTTNFNVVRAKGDEETAERRRQDALAEDRWCAEFPRLLETLAARGLELDVTRRLEAGEVPVQVVDGAGLPARADEADGEATRPRQAPRAHGWP